MKKSTSHPFFIAGAGYFNQPRLFSIFGTRVVLVLVLYGKQRLDMLKRFLELPSGNPSRGTFNRVFAMLAPARLEAALSNWVRSLVPDLEGEHIAIDGKSIRGSNKPTSHSFVHLVSAFACGNGISLAQVKVDEKSNEITAIPKLLDISSRCTRRRAVRACPTA